MIIWILFTLLLLVYLYPNRAIFTKARPDLPGRRGFPLIGHLPYAFSYAHKPHESELEGCREYGPVWSGTLPFIGRIITFVAPDSVEHLVKTNIGNYVRGSLFKRMMNEILGEGIFNSDGEQWRWQRKVAAQVFMDKRFKMITANTFAWQTQKFIHLIQMNQDKALDVQDLFYRFTLENFGQVAFTSSFGCLDSISSSVPFADALSFVQQYSVLRFNTPLFWLHEWLKPSYWRFCRDLRIMNDYAYSIIRSRRSSTCPTPIRPDLLSLFMDYRDEDEKELSDKYLRDIILNFIFAGRDTTAQLLSWTTHNLLANPSALSQLRSETVSLPPISEDTLHLHTYAHAVLYETLRLYPSVPTNIRCTLKRDHIPCEGQSILVEPGTIVQWSTYVMNRRPELWGPDSLTFNPSRFIDPNGKLIHVSPFKFPVFNAGPRTCLGKGFAEQEAVMVLVPLLQHFEISRASEIQREEEVRYEVSITLPIRHGLWVKFKERTQ
ncbi:cytochrome P450 [Saitoella complicata NRRL Y-17804]|nr:cytochrome P450 [Saitoella complicata NRRL Y-17804]ODQ53085.1 cytochrome P450 [Saitoella complicata NRRL Y-17804]